VALNLPSEPFYLGLGVLLLAIGREILLLRRNVTIEEVGNAGAFLCSDLASGISGEILYVDGGFNTTAMGAIED